MVPVGAGLCACLVPLSYIYLLCLLCITGFLGGHGDPPLRMPGSYHRTLLVKRYRYMVYLSQLASWLGRPVGFSTSVR